MRDADRVAGLLKSYRFGRVGLVVNRMRKDLVRKGEVLSPDEIAKALSLPLYCSIPEEDKFFLENVSPRSRAYRALTELIIELPFREAKRKQG